MRFLLLLCIMLNNNQCMTAALDIMCVLCSDLQVESPERVKEGDSVRLTCKSSCALTDRETFIWYRNSQTLLREETETINSCCSQSEERMQADIAVLYMDTLTPLLLFISMSRVSTDSIIFCYHMNKCIQISLNKVIRLCSNKFGKKCKINI